MSRNWNAVLGVSDSYVILCILVSQENFTKPPVSTLNILILRSQFTNRSCFLPYFAIKLFLGKRNPPPQAKDMQTKKNLWNYFGFQKWAHREAIFLEECNGNGKGSSRSREAPKRSTSRDRSYLQLVVNFLHFGSLGEIFVQIEKVLELKLGQRQRVALPRGQSGNVERFLHTPPVILVGGERFDDAGRRCVTGSRQSRRGSSSDGKERKRRENED